MIYVPGIRFGGSHRRTPHTAGEEATSDVFVEYACCINTAVAVVVSFYHCDHNTPFVECPLRERFTHEYTYAP